MPFRDPEYRRAYMRKYVEANREKLREWQRQWQATHADSLRAYRQKYHAKRLAADLAAVREEQRTAWLQRRYGLTISQFDAMVVAQDGRCAICGDTPADGRSLHIDHDHTSNRVRGLLCGHCNRAIGLFRDNPTVMASAVIYLRKWSIV